MTDEPNDRPRRGMWNLAPPPRYLLTPASIRITHPDGRETTLPLAALPDDPAPPPATDVDRVIDALDRRIVQPRDRTRLRDAVDRADAPLGGRAGQDEGLGRAIGKGFGR